MPPIFGTATPELNRYIHCIYFDEHIAIVTAHMIYHCIHMFLLPAAHLPSTPSFIHWLGLPTMSYVYMVISKATHCTHLRNSPTSWTVSGGAPEAWDKSEPLHSTMEAIYKREKKNECLLTRCTYIPVQVLISTWPLYSCRLQHMYYHT